MAKADAMGRVTAESSHGQVHEYEYDLAGNRTKVTYSTGRIVETSYDGLNRPEAIVDGDRLTRYGYDKAGRAVILVAANGQTSSNTYDALGRLTDRVLYKTPAMDPAQRLAQFKWQHDLLGNVTQQEEIWPGETTRSGDFLRTTMGYDANNRLTSESIITYYETYDEGQTTTYTYDDANNRSSKTVTGGAEPGHWDYTYNAANQLTAWEHLDYPGGSVLRSASLTYDDAGNRTSQAVTQISGSYNPTYNPQPAVSGLTQYTWDAQDRLASVTLPATVAAGVSTPSRTFRYTYDYRTRRVGTHETPSPISNPPSGAKHTSIVFSGGLSVAEWESSGSQPSTLNSQPTVEYTRGPDMGSGVGGLLYTSRAAESSSSSYSASSSRTVKYNLSNGRGDIVAQSDAYASLTWTASYEAYGKRTKETGENKDKQRGNSKDEDPTGLLNEGFRYRDIETGVWLSRDPAGFVDGPNLYAYVMQNPWTSFDPDGLEAKPAAPTNFLEWFNPNHPNYPNDVHIEKGMKAVAAANPKRLVVGLHCTPYDGLNGDTGQVVRERWLAGEIKKHPFYKECEGVLFTGCRSGEITKKNPSPLAARVAKQLGEKEVEAPGEYGYTYVDGTYGSVPPKPGATERVRGHVDVDYSKGGTMNVFDKKGKLIRSNPSPPRPDLVERAVKAKEEPKQSFWQRFKDIFKRKQKS